MRLLILLQLFFTWHLYAGTLKLDIYEIVRSKVESQDHIVKNLDGRVFWVDFDEKAILSKLEFARLSDSHVAVQHDADKYIVQVFETSAKPEGVRSGALDRSLDWAPTNYATLDQVNKVFLTMNASVNAGAQCYQKAQYWAYNLHTQRVLSEKVFLFFTNRYIREYNFEWWYHVAPSVRLQGTIQILDRSFFSNPRNFESWKNRFLYNSARCAVMRHMNDYQTYGNTQYCLYRVMPMFYYNPVNLQNYDLYGTAVYGWNMSEVQDAFRGVGY